MTATAPKITNCLQSSNQMCKLTINVCGVAIEEDAVIGSPLPLCRDDADQVAAAVQAVELHVDDHEDSLVGVRVIALHVDAELAPGARYSIRRRRSSGCASSVTPSVLSGSTTSSSSGTLCR